MARETASVHVFEKDPLGALLISALQQKYPPTSSKVKCVRLQPILDEMNIHRPMDEIPDQFLFGLALEYFLKNVSDNTKQESIVISHASTDEGVRAAVALAPTIFSVIARLPDGGANRHDLDLMGAMNTLKSHRITVLSSYLHYVEMVPLAVAQVLRSG